MCPAWGDWFLCSLIGAHPVTPTHLVSFSTDQLARSSQTDRYTEQSNSQVSSLVLEIEAREVECPGQGRKVLEIVGKG